MEKKKSIIAGLVNMSEHENIKKNPPISSPPGLARLMYMKVSSL